MEQRDPILDNDLGESIADLPIRDCHISFRRQRGNGDLWWVVSGTRAVLAHCILPSSIFEQVRTRRDPADPLARRARGRYAKWPQVRIDADLLIAVRARASHVEWHTMFGDGTPFGGGGGWLPTAERESLLERAQLWLSGHRGRNVSVARMVDPRD